MVLHPPSQNPSQRLDGFSLIIHIAGVGSQTSLGFFATFPGGKVFPPERAFGAL